MVRDPSLHEYDSTPSPNISSQPLHNCHTIQKKKSKFPREMLPFPKKKKMKKKDPRFTQFRKVHSK